MKHNVGAERHFHGPSAPSGHSEEALGSVRVDVCFSWINIDNDMI